MITCSMRAIEEEGERYTSVSAYAVEDPFLQRRRERRKGSRLSNPAITKAASQTARQNRKENLAIRTLSGIIPAAHPRLDAERRRGSLLNGQQGIKYLFASRDSSSHSPCKATTRSIPVACLEPRHHTASDSLAPPAATTPSGSRCGRNTEQATSSLAGLTYTKGIRLPTRSSSLARPSQPGMQPDFGPSAKRSTPKTWNYGSGRTATPEPRRSTSHHVARLTLTCQSWKDFDSVEVASTILSPVCSKRRLQKKQVASRLNSRLQVCCCRWVVPLTTKSHSFRRPHRLISIQEAARTEQFEDPGITIASDLHLSRSCHPKGQTHNHLWCAPGTQQCYSIL